MDGVFDFIMKAKSLLPLSQSENIAISMKLLEFLSVYQELNN